MGPYFLSDIARLSPLVEITSLLLYRKAPRTKDVDNVRHLVQLLRADIRAVGEAKVHERPLTEEILLSELLAVLVDEVEGPANQRLAGLR
jgi:hypothetical protein